MTIRESNTMKTNPNPKLQLLIDQGMNAVEVAMINVVSSDVDVLKDASLHILKAGGKRIRPRLLILAYLLCGGDDVEHAAPAGAAIELMHTASVVHDDINDHGVVRRGLPSVNSIWGRTFALLTGDFLFTAVYTLLAPYSDLNIDLAAAARALVEGETLQASAVKNNNFTREIYAEIIALKTAALFQAAGAMGAKLAKADDQQITALEQFTFNVGLAFQIIDDVLDIIGDERVLGKTSGIDIEQGRGFASAYQSEAKSEIEEMEDVSVSIKRKLLQGNALQEAQDQAKMIINQAISCLSIFPDSPAKDEMIEVANLVIQRDH
ncbi:polyprenyl synthetase family protein [Anaerolineales bacterium]